MLMAAMILLGPIAAGQPFVGVGYAVCGDVNVGWHI